MTSSPSTSDSSPCIWNKICTCYQGLQDPAWPGPCQFLYPHLSDSCGLRDIGCFSAASPATLFPTWSFTPLLATGLLLLFVRLVLAYPCVTIAMPLVQGAFFNSHLKQLPRHWDTYIRLLIFSIFISELVDFLYKFVLPPQFKNLS